MKFREENKMTAVNNLVFKRTFLLYQLGQVYKLTQRKQAKKNKSSGVEER